MKHLLISAIIIALIAPFSAEGARPKKSKKKNVPNPTEVLAQAKTAFDAYDFNKAIELIRNYETEAEKEPTAEMEHLLHYAELGTTMMSRVERIAIIDSITVDEKNFFEKYSLSEQSGYITSTDELPKGFANDDSTTVYVTESGETMLWSRRTEDGLNRELVTTHLLADGSWEKPVTLGEALEDIYANYPFLQPDGTTLYFAAKGEESLGGYDIFITRFDGEEYLQPQNLGMPYNSPFNDYLLAIDEQTGAGWWVTDRNQIEGKLTIYVFVPQELRINYSIDDPNLAKRAFITSIAATQAPDKDYTVILNAIEATNTSIASNKDYFTIAIPGRGILTSYEQFESPDAQNAMRQRQASIDELNEFELNLKEMRRKYTSDKSLKEAILDAETQIEDMRLKIKQLTNEVILLETN